MNKEEREVLEQKMSENTSSQSAILSLMMQSDGKRVLTLEDSVRDTQEKVLDTVNKSVSIKDEYGNSLLAIGTDSKVESFTNYGFSNDTLNFPLWLALYNDSWVFRRAIDKPAQDEIRCGITIQGDFDKSTINKYLKKARFDLIQLLQWGALFGGSVAVMMFDKLVDEDYAKPLNVAKLRKSKVVRYYVTDRWYGVSPSSNTVKNMKNLDFGKPMYYDITFSDGKTLKVHHDYVIRYEHRIAPKLIKNGQLQGWGYAEGSHILNELSRDDKLKASIQGLIDKSLIEVIKMSGMRGVFMGTDTASELQLRKRLEMVNWGRSFNSLTFLDKEDDYSMNHFNGLAGLSDILEKNMWLISAALEMQGVLFGDLKSGFANDAEALERYDETINGRCENYVRPVYEKLLKNLYIMLGINEKVEFTFNSLLMKQQNEKRMDNIQKFVDLSTRLLDAGVIDTSEFAKALKNYTQNDTVDFAIDDDKIKKLEKSMEEESEDFDFDMDEEGNENIGENSLGEV